MTLSRRAFIGGSAATLGAGLTGILALPEIASAKTPINPKLGESYAGIFSRQAYPAYGTAFTRDMAQMPVAPNSYKIAPNIKNLARLYRPEVPRPPTALNLINGNHPVYVVDSKSPNCRFATFSSEFNRVLANPNIVKYCLGTIPVPHQFDWPFPGDQAAAIYDQATGIMREYFFLVQPDPKKDAYTCSSAGYYKAGINFTRLAQRNFFMQLTAGSSSVVGMLSSLSQIGIAELQAGEINHAVSFTIPEARGGALCFPARFNDGHGDPNDESLPYEGQWFRLKKTVDISKLKPMTQLIARAAQKYGGYPADRNTFTNAFNMESAQPYINQGTPKRPRPDPYAAGSPLAVKYGNFDVSDFPWEETEWAEPNWKGTAQYPQPSQVWADNFGRFYRVRARRGLFTGTPDSAGRVTLRLVRETRIYEDCYRWAKFSLGSNGLPVVPRIKYQGTYNGAVSEYYKVKLVATGEEFFAPVK